MNIKMIKKNYLKSVRMQLSWLKKQMGYLVWLKMCLVTLQKLIALNTKLIFKNTKSFIDFQVCEHNLIR